MTQSRTERRSRAREERRRLLLMGTFVAAALALGAAALVGQPDPSAPGPAAEEAAPAGGLLPTSVVATGSEAAAATGTDLVAVPGARGATAPESDGLSAALTGRVVCLDPGHQASANLAPEPVGPGATETKPSVTGGAVGVVTGQAEHEFALDVARRVKRLLEARGVTVVLTRTTSETDISNAERAEVANRSGADLLVRIHADSMANAEARGVSTMYPGGNRWVGPIAARSRAAAEHIQRAVVAATGAPDRGIVERSDLAGFNWSSVPAVLVEAGFLSNPVEDRLLADGAYRERVAEGIAGGIVAYLSE
jgi:N-acetylmuramoyl-L-alanine amidase